MICVHACVISPTPPQVISPIEATGLVEVVAGLADIQDKVFTTPTVLIAEQVRRQGSWGGVDGV